MEENSIEEDIKIVENYLANSAMNEIESDFFKNGGWEIIDLEIPKSMQHILSDYKRVLKENEELKEELETEQNERLLCHIREKQMIPVQKIKDKIEYLEDYIEENSDEQGYWGNINPDVIYGQIEILKEILKESEE